MIDTNMVIKMYLAGDSLMKISRGFSCGRTKIRTILVDNGIPIRSCSETKTLKCLEYMTSGIKLCSICKKDKPIDSFWSGNTSRTKSSYCKDCGSSVNRPAHLKRRYNITSEFYDLMFLEQKGKCFCGSTNPGHKRRYFAVDHDHSCCPTEKSCGLCVRGLICHPCNIMLGVAEDNIDTLKAAIQYLESNKFTQRKDLNGSHITNHDDTKT